MKTLFINDGSDTFLPADFTSPDDETPKATPSKFGGIKADPKIESDTQPVNIDPETGKLFTEPGGSGTDISLGVTAAQVGQIIKVKEVGPDGAPTEWEAADLPSGGGNGTTTPKRIIDFTLQESVKFFQVVFSKQNADDLKSCSAIRVWLTMPTSKTEPKRGNLTIGLYRDYWIHFFGNIRTDDAVPSTSPENQGKFIALFTKDLGQHGFNIYSYIYQYYSYKNVEIASVAAINEGIIEGARIRAETNTSFEVGTHLIVEVS